MLPICHISIPVRDLEETRHFYCDVLGCMLGRAGDNWMDFDFYGHQLSAHMRLSDVRKPATTLVDGEHTPVQQFGVIISWDAWTRLRERLIGLHVDFIRSPHILHAGEPHEQALMRILDPSGNAVEFKALKYPEALFA